MNFTTTLATAALAAGLLAPAAARADDGPYVSVRGGLSQAQTYSGTVGVASAVVNGLRESHRIGLEADVAAGYQLGPLRLEVEGSQKRTRISSVFTASTVTIPNSATNLTSKGSGTFSAPSGRTRTRSAMANLIVSTTNRDIFADGAVHFFGGAGVGYAWGRTFNHRAVHGSKAFLNSGGRSFAWQLIGGVRYDLSRHISVDASYKYFSAVRMRFTDYANRRVVGSQNWNGFMVGATYAF